MITKSYVFTENTLEEVIKQVNEFKKLIGSEFPRQKIKVTFNDEVEIQQNKYKTKKVKEVELSFFTYGPNKNNLAYSTRISPRHGYPVHLHFLNSLKSFEISKPKDEDKYIVDKTMSLLGKFHNNLWSNIREELSKDPMLMKTKYYSNFKTISIANKFPKRVIEDLKKAIDNKENYRYSQCGTKRDLSVEVKMGNDGIYRAWYSSEYAGCGNGSYYLLLSPTIAGFREDD